MAAIRIISGIARQAIQRRMLRQLGRDAIKAANQSARSIRVEADVKGGAALSQQIAAHKAQARQMNGASVTVGIHGGKHRESGESLAKRAARNEYGDPDRSLPERPAFRRSNENAGQIIRKGIESGASLDAIGGELAADLRNEIDLLRRPENAPSTLEQKAGDNPLVDTRETLEAIGHRVERRG